MILTAENIGALLKETAVNMPPEDIAMETAVEDTEENTVGGEKLPWNIQVKFVPGPGMFHTVLAWIGVILSALWLLLSTDYTIVGENMWTTHFANDCFIPYLDHGMMAGDISAYPSFELDMFVLLMTLIRWTYFSLMMGLLLELKNERKTHLKIWTIAMFIFLATVWSTLFIDPLFKEMSKDWTFYLMLMQIYTTFLWVVMLLLIKKMGEKLVMDLSIV